MPLFPSRTMIAIFASFCLIASSVAQQEPVERTSFAEVTEHLDIGGNFYLYMSTERFLKEFGSEFGDFQDMLLTMAAAPDELDEANAVFDLLAKSVEQSGIANVSGIGLSSIARSEDLYLNKAVIHRYADAERGKLWDMFGAKSHELGALKMLPENTVLAGFGDLNLELLWNWISEAISESEIPELHRGFVEMQSELLREGVNLKQLFASVDSEMGVVMTTDEETQVPFETPDGLIQAPSISIMLVVKVKDDTLFELIDGTLPPDPEIERVDTLEMRLRSMESPSPLPIIFAPSIALSHNYLMLATNPGIINAAMATLNGKQPGLTAGDEFKRLSQDVPTEGVGFHFISSSLSKQLRQFAVQMAKGMPPQEAAFMNQILEKQGDDMYSYGVSEHCADSFYFTGNAQSGIAKSVILPAAAAPTAVMAGMLMPALSQSREKARRVSCMNNLKQIGLASFMWASENDGQFPDSFKQLMESELLPAGKVWSCPSHPEADTSPKRSHYVYVGKGLSDDLKKASITVLAYEKANKHPGSAWSNVLFADGHVEAVQGPFKEAAAARGWRVGNTKRKKRDK
jgi:prepilin-type processing-associated H-X9-DG protein